MYIKVNGVKLFYEVKGSGRDLILVHGNGENHHIFDWLVDVLKDNFKCYCIDSRGHGQSSKVNEYNYHVMANDVIALIEELGLQEVAYYGFSDGGIIGLIVASQTNLIKDLIISGANLNPNGLKNNVYLMMKLEYFFKRDPKVKLMLTQPNITHDDLAKIKARTLVLAGSNDVVKEKHTIEIVNYLSNSELMILSGENHSSYVIDSTKLAPIILGYLK